MPNKVEFERKIIEIIKEELGLEKNCYFQCLKIEMSVDSLPQIEARIIYA